MTTQASTNMAYFAPLQNGLDPRIGLLLTTSRGLIVMHLTTVQKRRQHGPNWAVSSACHQLLRTSNPRPPRPLQPPKGLTLSGLNTWGKEDLERRNHELSVLNEIARELNRSVELGEALGFTLSQVAELLGLRTAWIWLMDDSSPGALPGRGPQPPTGPRGRPAPHGRLGLLLLPGHLQEG